MTARTVYSPKMPLEPTLNVSPLPLSNFAHRDGVYDVVIVGFGAAGTCAAIEAARAGAKVLVLERTGGAGGAAALAEGILYMGGGTATQIDAGVSDTKEAMRAYLMEACGPEVDVAKIDAYVEGSIGHHDWLVDLGIEFEPSIDLETQMAPKGTEGLVWSGGENAWPFNEIATPAPRGHLAKTKRSTGWLLMQTLSEAAVALGVEVLYDTKVERLLSNGDRVVGLEASRYGEPYIAQATKAVILCAGGFIYNDDMVAAHAPELLQGTWKVGTEADDGRGIQMGMALGAQTKSMHAGEVSLPIIPPRKLVEGILVNGYGQRFINEDTYMGRVGQAALYDQGATCFLIVDEACYEPNWMGIEAAWVCETVEELEQEMGLVPGALAGTVALYNRHAENGEDPMFHKAKDYVRPLVPPLGAFDLRPGVAPYAPFTLGGLATNVDGQVLHIDGAAIPGLYAAGRTTSGVCSFGYASGLSIGDSTYFGRLAGKAAAAEESR